VEKIIKKIMTASIPLSPESEKDIISILEIKTFSKYQFLLKKGTICNFWGFIDSGLIRIFYDKNGKEITEFILPENSFFSSIESFFLQIPGKIEMEALEPSRVAIFRYDKLEDLCKKNPEINFFFRKILENNLLIMQKRIKYLLFETASERYDMLHKLHPSLILRIPSVYIASYLGITPETFSRLKKKKNRK
jgi:CRP-like cAMP-binding protein